MKETTFMERCKGIALVLGVALFGTAAILFSTQPAQADSGPEMTNSTGRYQMELATAIGSSGTVFWYILVYNTESGRSKFYYGSTKKGTTAASSQYNLPSSPL